MSAQQNQALTAEQIVAELKRKHADESPLARVPKIVKLVAAAAVCGIVLSIIGVGTFGDIEIANAEKLAKAEEAYSSAVETLDSVFDQNHRAASQLAADIDHGVTLVDTASEVSEACNGFVDPAALTALTTHMVQLSTAINAQAGTSARTYENPRTADEYQDARSLAIAQTRINRDALKHTDESIRVVSSKIAVTTADVTTVATTVGAIAPQILTVNNHAHAETQAELSATVADVQTALTSGGDVAATLTKYGTVARAVQESNSEYTGKPPTPVVATIVIPKPPTTMTPASQIGNDSKPTTGVAKPPATTTPPAASGSHQQGANPAPASKPAPSNNPAPVEPSTKPAPPAPAPAPPKASQAVPPPPKLPFTIAVNTSSSYTPGCDKAIPIGGGVAYGPPGTTKTVSLFYPVKYTYTLNMTSATSGTWIVYACKVNKTGRSDPPGHVKHQD